MEQEKKINAFLKLGEFLAQFENKKPIAKFKILNNKYFHTIENEIINAGNKNKWFTENFVRFAIIAIANELTYENLNTWLSRYYFDENIEKSKVGVVMAGNIPLVGFHDWLCILLSGNVFIGKLSSKDNDLLQLISKILITIQPEFDNKIFFIEDKLSNFDAVIATGSNNTSRYFEYYFGKYPNIIRQNRNSVAVLDGTESELELSALGDDIFLYFGLGCRNVSKIYVPENYNFDKFINAFNKYGYFINHSGYMNNYDYNKSIFLINRIEFLDGKFFILTDNSNFASPISVIYYEFYHKKEELISKLNLEKNKIQCIVSNELGNLKTIPFGEAQTPELWDYADGIDTMKFLLNIK